MPTEYGVLRCQCGGEARVVSGNRVVCAWKCSAPALEARRTGQRPTTSRERWDQSPAVVELRERVFAVLRDFGPMTDASLERRPEFDDQPRAYSTIRARRDELVKEGRVEACGSVVDRNRQGRRTRMTVWQVVGTANVSAGVA